MLVYITPKQITNIIYTLPVRIYLIGSRLVLRYNWSILYSIYYILNVGVDEYSQVRDNFAVVMS